MLEVGTGRIDRIYVLVPDDEGTFQVAVGGVYSYYEFTSPPGERLTDEAWRAMLDAGEAPERPAWEEAFLAGLSHRVRLREGRHAGRHRVALPPAACASASSCFGELDLSYARRA